jgi:hypothetical protein
MSQCGWIYLRKVLDKGYCIGKTVDHLRRSAEYAKENPFIEDVDHFFAMDIDAVEGELIIHTKEFRLLDNSKEWLRYSSEVRTIFSSFKEKYGLLTNDEWKQLVQSRKTFECKECKYLLPVSDRALAKCPSCGEWNAVP